MFTFYLGTHHPAWLAQTNAPLMVSHTVLRTRRTLPRARAPWALDSGGFTQLRLHGRFLEPPRAYAAAVRRYRDEIGRLEWAAVQDWMCEPGIRRRTQGTVQEHQRRTIQSYLELREIDPTLPWVPVLQGWAPEDYLRHVDLYLSMGVPFRAIARVGIGSLCRRRFTAHVAAILSQFYGQGLALHAFGVKSAALRQVFPLLRSADSMAWSTRARWDEPLPGHTHRRCNNCLVYALDWRHRLLRGGGIV